MRRRYYLCQRKNGFFYVEFVDPESGVKLGAKNTGATKRREAEIICDLWLKNGIPAGKKKEAKPIAEIAEVEIILRQIRKADLAAEGAMEIVNALKKGN